MQAMAMLTAAALTFGFGGVKGNGSIKSESRAVSDFHAVSIGSGIQAKVTLGERASLVLEGDENLLPLLEVKQEGGRLTLGSTKSLRPTQAIRATLVTPRLDSVDASGGSRVEAPATPGPRFTIGASGGSKVEIDGLDSAELVVDGSGGSTLKITGRAGRLTVEASGGSKVLAADVPVTDAKVDASGGSRVELAVSHEVKGETSGGSTVALRGQPQIRGIGRSGGSRVVVE